MKKPLLVASAIVENARGEVLLAQRPEGKALAGYWEFPGGKIEVGESEADALRRELKEELELDVRLEEKLGGFTHNYPWGAVRLEMFRARALNEPRLTADVAQFRWLDAHAIDPQTLAPADLAPLAHYLASRT